MIVASSVHRKQTVRRFNHFWAVCFGLNAAIIVHSAVKIGEILKKHVKMLLTNKYYLCIL